MEEDVPRPEYLQAGEDETDPYAGESLNEYPDWWRRNIEEFRDHNMRPYRPPRFNGGEYTPPVIADLEAELGVTIELRSVNPQEEGNWGVRVDGKRLTTIGHHREGDGYSVYEISRAEFEDRVRSQAAGKQS